MTSWDAGDVGVLTLPSGRLVRGRGLSKPMPEGPEPTFALYLLGAEPSPVRWQYEWVRWRDFRRPADLPGQRRFVSHFTGVPR